MLVTEILKDKGDAVFSVAPDKTLVEACREMQTRKIGAVMVCDSDRVVGVLSERDVVRAVAASGPEALSEAVSAYMTRDIVFAEPTATESDDRPPDPPSAGAAREAPHRRHLDRGCREMPD